ncbi:hypothetical protein V6Z11_D09G193700 [Gossypium hirsutum]
MDYWELKCRLESSIFTYFAFRFSSEEYEAAKGYMPIQVIKEF